MRRRRSDDNKWLFRIALGDSTPPAPVILLTGTTVSEDATVGTTVGTLSIGNTFTGTPAYTLVDSAGGKFSLTGALIKVAAALDYETATTHNIVVSVSGITPAAPNRTLTITVTDVVEVTPVIQLTGTTVNEDAAVNTTVGTLSVTGTYTGTPVYTLTDSAGGKFNISGALLRVNAALDYETAATHSVTVSVSGITPAAANKAFTVVVLDIVESGGPAFTWNPSDKSTYISLSGSDLVAIAGTADFGSQHGVRGTVSKSTGKYFCKFTITEETFINFVGIRTAGSLDPPSGYPGSVQYGVGYGAGAGPGNGEIIYDGGLAGTTQLDYVTGDVISMATDFDAGKIWFRRNSDNWNNNASADPAAGTGGVNVTTGQTYFVTCSFNTFTGGVGKITLDPSGTGAPTGFLAWGGGGVVGTTKNIVTDYGAVGDGEWASATLTIAASGTTLTASTALWTAGTTPTGDVGKAIVVGAIGAGGNSLNTTIAAVGGGGTQVTLAHAASSALSATPGIIVCWGTNNGKTLGDGGVDGPFETFRKAHIGLDVTLTIPAGTYLIGSGNFGGLFNGIRSIMVNATGATLCGGLFQIQTSAQYQDGVHHARTASVSAAATSVTLTTPSEVSRFVIGNYAMMTGFDLQAIGYPSNLHLFEFLKITAIDSDSGSPTYGKITFLTPLRHSYLSTWPHYRDSSGEIDWGGPATLYAMNPYFEHTSVTNNLTVVQHQQWAMTGMDLTFNNCVFHSFAGNAGPHPSMAVSIVMNNCVAAEATMEVDKQVEYFELNGCTWGGLAIQSSSVEEMVLDNTDISFTISGSPQKTIIRNGCTIGTLAPGPNYFGFAHELTVSDSFIDNFTGTGGGAFIKGGDINNNGLHVDYSMASGVITVPSAMCAPTIANAGVTQWAILGEKVFLWDGGTLGMFTITAVSRANLSSPVIVTTDWSGGFPSRTYNPANGLFFLRHPTPLVTFTNVTGCAEVVDLCNASALGQPLNSYTKRTYVGSAGTGVLINVWGRFKKIVVDVTVASTGAGGPVRASLGNSNNTPIKVSDRTNAAMWTPVIDLTKTGVRTFDATAGTYPVTWGSTAVAAADTLPSQTEALWCASNFKVDVQNDFGGSAATFSVEFIADQGFA